MGNIASVLETHHIKFNEPISIIWELMQQSPLDKLRRIRACLDSMPLEHFWYMSIHTEGQYLGI